MVSRLKQSENRVVGTRQILKKFAADGIETLFVADNAQEYLKAQLTALAAEKNAAVIVVRTMEELGKMCGIEVGAAAAGVLRNGPVN